MKKALREAEAAYEKGEIPIGAVIVINNQIKVVYGARDEHRGCINLNTKLHPKTELMGGIMAEEASQLLKRFFIEKRNLN